MIFCDWAPRSERSDRISPQRGTISANGEIYTQQIHWSSCLRDYSVWFHRSFEICCHNGRILLKNSKIWLSGADQVGFLHNPTRSRQTEKYTPSKCIEVHACAITASGSIGASSSAVTTVGFCWKTAQFGSREPIWLDFSATRYDLGKRRNIPSANVLNFMLPRLQRLGPSEHRVVLSQRSDFAEKLHNLALGSQYRSNRSVNRAGGGVGRAKPPPPWLTLTLTLIIKQVFW